MGGYYGSIHFRQIDRAQLLRETESLATSTQRKFLVGSERNGWTAVYPDEHGQDESVAAELAKALNAPALHLFVHDDDIFAYTFYRGAELVDEFNSCPEYFGDEVSAAKKARLRGNLDLLRETVGPDADLKAAKALLAKNHRSFTLEVERLEKFAALLGIENAVTSYEYLLGGERDHIKGWKQFVAVPDERASKRAAASGLKKAKERLERDGVLLGEIQAPAERSSGKARSYMPVWCVDPAEDRVWFVPRQWRTGFFEETGTLPLCSWTPGEREARVVDPQISATIFNLEVSPSGRWLAIGNASGNWTMELRERQEPHRRHVVPHAHAVEHVFFYPDESRLLQAGSGELAIIAVADGAQLASAKSQSGPFGRAVALHPSGRWIVACRHHGELQILDGETLETKREITTHRGMQGDFSALPAMMERLLASGMSPAEMQVATMRAANPEGFATFAFSADGQWLCTGSTLGLRVYRWADLVGADAAMDAGANAARDDDGAPRPVYSVDARPNAIGKGHHTYCYTVAVDDCGNRVLFAGLEGIVESLDLTTGKVTTLLDPPERLGIVRIALSAGRSFLIVQAREFVINSQRPPELTAWNYPRLLEQAQQGTA